MANLRYFDIEPLRFLAFVKKKKNESSLFQYFFPQITIELVRFIFEQVKLIFAEYVSSILYLEANISVIKLRPYSMSKYTLPRI
jgi:hypothetical protein